MNTVEIIKDFPLTGTGLGTYLYAYPMYETRFSGEMLEHAHNDYLELLAEGGVIAGGLIIVVAFGALAWLFSRWTRRNDHLVRGVGLGCLAGIAAILIHSLTDFNLHITANAVLFVTLYALAMRIIGLDTPLLHPLPQGERTRRNPDAKNNPSPLMGEGRGED
jgi:O-antigen ligase